HRQKQKKLIMLPSEMMIWQPEFTDKTLSRKPGAVQKILSIVTFHGSESPRYLSSALWFQAKISLLISGPHWKCLPEEFSKIPR
ncbi:hypothetical protein ACIQPM_005190, partial [Escherichia coli]